MFSTVSANFSPDSMLDNDPIPDIETNIMKWDWLELFSPSQSTGSPRSSGTGSDEAKQSLTGGSTSSLKDQKQRVPTIDERKLRRMISNRASARRSRMRKRNYLENLTNEVKQLQIQNQELNNRLKSLSDLNHCLRIDNNRVRFECSILQQEVLDMRQLLVFR
ncbi:hypothetical protein Goshw_008957 [Gossypium schwendimanii]|uniref:BZIP domain-containing protein n=1 Tax=Gossypium schwendimanii TaxID=34291 RepID=A0A7J9LEV6_GOSSC|nr:hypothetical protein [Gossypium schwendimanii]